MLPDAKARTIDIEAFFSYFSEDRGVSNHKAMDKSPLHEVDKNINIIQGKENNEHRRNNASSKRVKFHKDVGKENRRQQVSPRIDREKCLIKSNENAVSDASSSTRQNKRDKVQLNIISFDKDINGRNASIDHASLAQSSNLRSNDPLFAEHLISDLEKGLNKESVSKVTQDSQAAFHQRTPTLNPHISTVDCSEKYEDDIEHIMLSRVDTQQVNNRYNRHDDKRTESDVRSSKNIRREAQTYIESKSKPGFNKTNLHASEDANNRQRTPVSKVVEPVERVTRSKIAQELRDKSAQYRRDKSASSTVVQRKRQYVNRCDDSPTSKKQVFTPPISSNKHVRRGEVLPHPREDSTSYKFERIRSIENSVDSKHAEASLKYSGSTLDLRARQPSHPKSPHRGEKTVTHQLIMEMMGLETKLESQKIALSHSKEFNVSLLFEFIDTDHQGFITKIQLLRLLESINLQPDRKAFDRFFNKLVEKRPRVTFITFSKLFYPISSIQQDVMRKKMYNNNQSVSHYDMSTTTKSSLSSFFDTLISIYQVKEIAQEYFDRQDFEEFIYEMTGGQTPYFDTSHLEADPDYASFPDEIRQKVFEDMDCDRDGHVCMEDIYHFVHQ